MFHQFRQLYQRLRLSRSCWDLPRFPSWSCCGLMCLLSGHTLSLHSCTWIDTFQRQTSSCRKSSTRTKLERQLRIPEGLPSNSLSSDWRLRPTLQNAGRRKAGNQGMAIFYTYQFSDSDPASHCCMIEIKSEGEFQLEHSSCCRLRCISVTADNSLTCRFNWEWSIQEHESFILNTAIIT